MRGRSIAVVAFLTIAAVVSAQECTTSVFGGRRMNSNDASSSDCSPCKLVVHVVKARVVGTKRLSPDEQARIAADIEQRNYDCGMQSAVVERVVDALQQRGFFLAQVDKPEVTDLNSLGDRRDVALTIRVNEGYRYHLGELLLINYRAFSADQVRAQIQLGPGDLFDTAKLRQGLDNLRRLYASRGYLSYSVLPETEVDRDYRVVNLSLHFDEGPQFRVGSFAIAGLNPTLVQSLSAAWDLPPGSVYNPAALDRFFAAHRDQLPQGASPEVNSVLNIREGEHTVDVKLDFPPDDGSTAARNTKF